MLQAAELEPDTARKLLSASKTIAWSKLYPLLTKMADNSCTSKQWYVRPKLASFQALELLLGKITFFATGLASEHSRATACQLMHPAWSC